MTRLVFFISMACCLVTCAQAQDTRGIIPAEFVKTRPAKGPAAANANRRRTYRRTSARPSAAPGTEEFAQLGLTIWRLRPATSVDTGARIIVQKDDETIEFTPERVPSNAPLQIGERIRMSFESPQTGYLYVIDREQFADGSFGEPMLIFPTTRTRNGDNQVTAGKLIEIPAQEDRPNYFTMQQSRVANTSQTGEVLTVIVTAKPLEGITIGPRALTLTSEQVRQWEQQWGARTEIFDLSGGAGQTWTKAEQEAGANGTRQLTQEDPEPQTVYRVAVKPGAPLLVKVGLRYVRPKSGSRNLRR
jgi:hypothetical protein